MQSTAPSARSLLLGLLAGASGLAGSALSVVDVVGAEVFTVDSTQSSVSISGTVAGRTLHEQGSGSLTTHYQGTLVADVGADTIQFPGQSQVLAVNSGSWQPLSDGSDGSEPANYGGTASFFFTKGVAAVREVQVDVTSGAVAVVNGQFSTEGLTFTIPADGYSSLAYRVEGAYSAAGAVSLAGRSATGQIATASVTTWSGLQILTIPIQYTIYFTVVKQNDTSVTLSGQLVATRSL